ncbi:nucleotide-binding protein [Gemmatimonas sp.]|uniref:nucleotide-binding protein n=1 Tax=Gemmatimonas sp. TaxID=1962908 RepID=UPI0037BE3F02
MQQVGRAVRLRRVASVLAESIMRRVVLPGVLLFAVACADKSPDGAKGMASPSASSASATSGATAAPAIAPGSTLTGTLREQIPVGPYVYVRLDTDNGEVWAAVNNEPLAVGKSVTVYNVMLMENFQSPTLSRTFARIYFGALEPPGTTPQTSTGSAPDAMTNADQVGTPAAVDAGIGRISKATGANARTIGEVHAQQKGLAGTTVTVRGVVVKYNEGVMGKNWIHIQDGSGSAAKGTHDLTATSLDRVAVGDTVTITGALRLDRDFGAGYVYPLVLEDSKLSRR